MNSIPQPQENKKIPITDFRLVESQKIPPIILEVECDQETITAHLSDSRSIAIPTGWYAVFREATLNQLKNVRVLPAKRGIYWPDLEEFLSIRAFTHGLNAGC